MFNSTKYSGKHSSVHRVLLINPLGPSRTKHTHYIRDWCGGENAASMLFPPLELAQTTALLRKAGHHVCLIDANALHIDHFSLLKALNFSHVDWAIIPSAWGSLDDDIVLAKLLKKRFQPMKIVFYGANVTVDPLGALKSEAVDYVIRGEPEYSSLRLLDGDTSQNIAFLHDEKLVSPDIIINPDLNSLPFPARDLLPNHLYTMPFTRTSPFTMTYSSRGCAYNCDFCPVCLWYDNNMRFRSSENVVAELEEIVSEYGIRDLIFRDPSFTLNQDHAASICNGIIRSGLKVNWRCFSHVNDTDKALLNLMKEAGCYQISYGFESGNQKSLNNISKASNISSGIKAARLTREAGIEVSGSFIIGLPGESVQDMKKTVSFSRSLNLDYAQYQVPVPIPGTVFANRLNTAEVNKASEEDNILISNDSSLWKWNELTNLINTDVQKGKELRKILKNAYRSFYMNPIFIYKRLISIRSIEELTALIRTAFKIKENFF